MKRVLIGIGIAAMLLAVPMTAGAQQTYSVKKTYEFAAHNAGEVWLAWTCPTGFVTGQVGEPNCDPTGTTQDGSIDLGGAVFTADNDPNVATAVSVQLSIVDDVYGAGVIMGVVCTDENDNNVCGEEEEGEARVAFCGDSPVLEFKGPGEFNAVASFVGGGTRHVTRDVGCDPAAAPIATSGGVLDPAGGIFHTFALA